jgi:hypothetical protein
LATTTGYDKNDINDKSYNHHGAGDTFGRLCRFGRTLGDCIANYVRPAACALRATRMRSTAPAGLGVPSRSPRASAATRAAFVRSETASRSHASEIASNMFSICWQFLYRQTERYPPEIFSGWNLRVRLPLNFKDTQHRQQRSRKSRRMDLRA